MDPVAEIERAPVAGLELAPPLSRATIERLEDEVGTALPDDVRALLEHTSGIEGTELDAIDFTGASLAFEEHDIFPHGLAIAGDGFGNFWVLDLTPESSAAPVFFACHDPPIVLYQSPDVGHFLRETFRMSVPPHESLVDDVHEDRLFNVWGENPGELSRAAALTGDESLRAFADELDDRFTFVDLRAPEIGMGFTWGRHGPRTEVRRHGYERVFAYAPPEQRPGLLRRLFG